MIVELVGLPGSGKSTFARELAKRRGWTFVKISSRGELLWYNLLFLLCHPVRAWRGISWFFQYCGPQKFRYTKFINLYIVYNAKYMKARKYPRAIIDQGHHQNVISLFETAVLPEVIDAYVRTLPKPDMLCFVLADSETRTARLAKRGYGARVGVPEDEREAWETARETNFECLFTERESLPFVTETVSPEDEKDKLERIAKAQLWYFVMHIRMPTEKAHGLQIAKTLEALTLSGIYAELIVSRRKNAITQSVGNYYGLTRTFPVRTINTPDILWLGAFIGRYAFIVESIFFALALLFMRLDKEGVHYTRNPEIACVLAFRGCRVYYEAHVWPASKHWLLKYFLADVSGIVCNSDGTAQEFKKAGFTNVEVVRNGVDLERFRTALSHDEARTLVGLPLGRTVIMYVGAFYAWKGVSLLLEAWRERFALREDLLLVLVGGGERELRKHGGYDAYRTIENVVLIEHEPASRIPAYLAAADLLLLPNNPVTEEAIHFTSPIKLFEYMASGRPIIASDLPSIRELLSEETAELVPAGDSGTLADGIDNVLLYPKEAAQRAARACVEVEQYSWQARAERLRKIASTV